MNWYKIATRNIKLWLDDDRDPHNPEIQKLFGATGDEVWVKTIDEAIPYLLTGNVIFVDFDNDLGKNIPEGKELAKWIKQKAINGEIEPPDYFPHTENKEAAKTIISNMEDAKRAWREKAWEHKESIWERE